MRPSWTKQRFRDLEHTTLILDSCPGEKTFLNCLEAFVYPVENIFMRIISFVITVTTVPTLNLLSLFGIRNPVRKNADLTNNTELLGNCSRAYIYSDSDRLVQAWVVERHSQKAASAGISTKLHKWHASPHVQHMKKDKVRYIDVITSQWKKALYGSVFFDSD